MKTRTFLKISNMSNREFVSEYPCSKCESTDVWFLNFVDDYGFCALSCTCCSRESVKGINWIDVKINWLKVNGYED